MLGFEEWTRIGSEFVCSDQRDKLVGEDGSRLLTANMAKVRGGEKALAVLHSLHP